MKQERLNGLAIISIEYDDMIKDFAAAKENFSLNVIFINYIESVCIWLFFCSKKEINEKALIEILPWSAIYVGKDHGFSRSRQRRNQ